MWWWNHSADLTRNGSVKRFGMITTNTIKQTFVRRVVEEKLKSQPSISLIFAIPDHHWVDSTDGAAVRIAMTAGQHDKSLGKLMSVIQEFSDSNETEDLVSHTITEIGAINSDLSIGTDLTSTKSLNSNKYLCSVGMKTIGSAFQVSRDNAIELGLGKDENLNNYIHPDLNGRDFVQSSRGIYVRDIFGVALDKLKLEFPNLYQYLLDFAKPERDQNRNKVFRELWLVIGHPRPQFREATNGLRRYIAIPETAKHQFFYFIETDIVPDSTLVTFVLDDAYFLGVLSSRVHVTWSLAAGGRLGIGNDPRYNKTRCFDPFPFPDPIDTQKQTIRELGERLDSHRKRVQTTHPEVTITGMYNLLEQLRKGEPLNDKDKAFNQKALVSTLKQIHDELDTAVFAAYGWESILTDDQILENLVTLNAQRAEEERNGHIRWLRPDYQNPGETYVQQTLEGITTETETAITPTEQQPFPKTLKEQLSAIRDLFRTQSGEWTATQVTAHFTGANRKQKVILDCLESLEDLGILLSHNEDGVTLWHLAELENAR